MSGKDKKGVVHTIWELTVLSKFHFVIAVDYRRVYIYICMYIICCRLYTRKLLVMLWYSSGVYERACYQSLGA